MPKLARALPGIVGAVAIVGGIGAATHSAAAAAITAGVFCLVADRRL